MAGSVFFMLAILCVGSTTVMVMFLNNRLSTDRHALAEADREEMVRLRAQLDKTQRQVKRLQNIVSSKSMAPQLDIQGASKQPRPIVRYRNEESRKRILVTGGAGFLGSHLVDRLMRDGHEVIALDNFYTGRRRNVEQWIGHPNFELVHHDIVNPYYSEVDRIYHLASPASPPHYMWNPVKTLKTNTIGTINLLGLARRVKARLLLASSSEVYGDPEVSPQEEDYFGHVNPVGPRSCYDEGKRAAEALLMAYKKQEKVDVRITRIFNSFGPRMHMNDGRVASNFAIQALKGEPMTIYGSGNQTRSFQYVSDLVEGLIALMESNVTEPVNIGNPEEVSINEFAEIIRRLVGSTNPIVHLRALQDDPQRRKPNISRAEHLLGWTPRVKMQEGLRLTIEYFRRELEAEKEKLIHSPPDL